MTYPIMGRIISSAASLLIEKFNDMNEQETNNIMAISHYRMKKLWLLVSVMTLCACGSQPAQVSYSVPKGIQSQQCYITQTQSYIWLEQEDEWLALPQQARQQFEGSDIDWLAENILIVSAGQKSSAGYGIELTNWLLEQNHWQVTRISHQPAVDSMQAQMLTSPCILVKIPKTIKSFTLNNEQGRALGRWPY